MKPVKSEQDIPGEGNYSATRRHRESAEQFVQEGRVDDAAREAEPRDEREQQALKEAEQKGLDKARH